MLQSSGPIGMPSQAALRAFGLSLFLAWVGCTFYTNATWQGGAVPWNFSEFPTMLMMAVSGCVALAVAVASRSGRFGERWATPQLALVAGSLCALGTLFIGGVIQTGSGDAILSAAIGAVVCAPGFAYMAFLWGDRVSRLEARSIELAAPVAFAVANLLAFVVNLLPGVAPVVISALLPLASALAFRRCRDTHDENLELAAVSDRRSGVAWAAVVALTLFLFRTWYGLIRAFGHGVGTEGPLFAATFVVLPIVVFSAFMVAALVFTRKVDLQLAVLWMVPILLFATASMHLGDPLGTSMVRVANRAASLCLQAFFYIILAKAAHRLAGGGLFCFACYIAGLAWGVAVGLAAGQLIEEATGAQGALAFLSFFASGATFATLYLGRKADSLEDAGLGIEKTVGRDGPPLTSDRIVDIVWDLPRIQVEGLAGDFGLSPREAEVALLLIRGESRSAIRDELTLSINTVNTHTRNLYSKAGVHSQQELIALVAERYPAASVIARECEGHLR